MEPPYIWEKGIHTDRPLSGRVKSIHTERADYYDDGGNWVEGLRRPEETFMCDREGRLLQQVQYSLDRSSVWRKYLYQYDSAGDLAEVITRDGDGSLVFRAIYSLEVGSWRQSVYEGDGRLLEEIVHIHDSDGNLVRAINHYPDGSIKARWSSELSAEGVVTREALEYAPDGSFKGRRIEVDDPRRRELQKSFYDANGSLQSRSVSYYDTNRSEIERRNYDSRGLLERRLTWQHDQSGNVTRTAEYSGNDQLEDERFLVYEYDDVGNWTKRTFLILVPGSAPAAYRPGPFIYRAITYWPEESAV